MTPAELEAAVAAALERLGSLDVTARIWRHDHTVWRPDPAEIADRLGWLFVHREMRPRLAELEAFAAECAAAGLRTAVLAGMGGSSLAPEVYRSCFGVADGMLDLLVLDTTHPDQILAVERSIDLERTLFVVASKSGSTIETASHLAYFWERVPDGSRFVAITDPGTQLQRIAGKRGFRRTFENPPDIGGRYSALSLFGLVPAALVGAPIATLLHGAGGMAEACGPGVPAGENPGAVLGAWMAQAVLAGRDKVTLLLPPGLAPFGSWAEQLLAESTGKDGTGIVPVDAEPIGARNAYGTDRLFVAYEGAADLEGLEGAGHPVLRLPAAEAADLGAELFRWEFATAVAGYGLGVQPFDQPDVQASKDAANRAFAGATPQQIQPGDLGQVLASVGPGDYVAVQAYLPRSAEVAERLQAMRVRLRDRYRVATTLGFGPRFLHSTGQLHKGGPDSVVPIQLVEPPAEDLPIPGTGRTFGQLLAAQAAGDLEALRSRGRRAVRTTLAELEAAV